MQAYCSAFAVLYLAFALTNLYKQKRLTHKSVMQLCLSLGFVLYLLHFMWTGFALGITAIIINVIIDTVGFTKARRHV